MRVQTTIAALASVASGLLMPRQSNDTAPATPNVAAAQYDG
jgi:apolipoprotein D and lipocalin family protein